MFTGTEVHIRHVAVCPEVDPLSCAETDIPEHMHDQRIAWFRLEPTLNVGLGQGWQVSASVPLDLRDVNVAYETMEGAPYDPPYDDIHHRTETLWGPVDGTLLVRRFFAPGRAVVGVGLGTTLPFGKTEEDPYALTEQGLRHQHLQLGTGTFVPMVTLDGTWAGPRWGAVGWVSGRLPLYANGHDYQPGAGVTGGLGPSFRVTPTVQLLATAEGSWEGPEQWSGEPYGGRATLLGGLTGTWALSPAVVLQVQARVTALQWMGHQDEDEGSAVQRFLGSAGVSWTFGGKSRER